MRYFSLDSVKDAFSIFSNGEDVLVAGKNLWIFRTNGSFVAKFKTILNPRKVAFLPNRTVIVDGYGDGGYHFISLENGEILWSSNKKGRRMMESNRFAVSPDGTTIYDVCYIQNKSMQIEKLCPQRKIHEFFMVKDCLRVTEDIFCDSDGILCALQTHLQVEPEDTYSPQNLKTWLHGILAIPFENGNPVPYWKDQWQSMGIGYVSARACDGKYILHDDFSVFDLEEQSTFQLLENEQSASLPRYGFDWSYDFARKLLTIFYIGSSKLNLIIDCKNKRIVAKYNRSDISIGYQGCLIGNEFWMGTDSGIVKKAFPNVDIIQK